MTRPDVSVVIPAYNCAKYVRDAIESALAQEGVNLEVIVVNDGSPDDTDAVVHPYLDRIIYIRQENRGLSAARNVGFRAGAGEFVCFLDADDAFLPGKLAAQLVVFEREPDLGVVICGYVDVAEDGRTEIHRVRKPWHRDGLQRLLRHEVFPPHTALVRRSALELSSLFPEDIDTWESQEDWQLWLDMALLGVQFGSVPEPLVLYRSRPGSIRANPLKHLDGASRVLRWLRAHPKAGPHLAGIESLASIVEMERVATAIKVGRTDIAAAELAVAVPRHPAFWRLPSTSHHFFIRTMTNVDFGRWQRGEDLAWYEQRVLGVLATLARELLPAEFWRPLVAAAWLSLADVAYAHGDTKVRHRALREAFRADARAWSRTRESLGSTARALVGPGAGRIIGSGIRGARRLLAGVRAR